MLLNAQLTRQIQSLDAQSLEELRLFIERLLNKQFANRENNVRTSKKGKRLLEDMERIPIPVDNIIVDRADLYDDRI